MKSISKYKKIMLIGITIVCLCSCSLNQNESLKGGTMQKTYTELAEIFNKYDIQEPPKQVLEEMEQQYKEIPPELELSKAAMLLTLLGRGDLDYTNGTWTPYENGVYSFDVEVSDLEKMYTDFLTGISALDKEELDFKNIQEDISQVNWEDGTGTTMITFEWKNKQFTIEAKANHDWLDLNVANELNELIKKHGNGKQLFFTDDGYQECIIFYRDKEWADAFQKETGLELT